MTNLRHGSWWLGAILAVSLIIRLSAVPYGLPYHVIGDEETNVYGALLMLQHHTLLPVLHQSDFVILYEPPLLAYIYAALFVPTIAVAYLASGAHGFNHFVSLLTLDPSVLWYIGRTLGVLFSLGSIYLVYKLALYFFKREMPALLSTLLFATSYISTTIASTAKQWTPGVFCSLLGFYLVCKALESRSHRTALLLFGGVALGLSFGFSYIPFYIPLVATLVIVELYRAASVWGSIKNIVWAGMVMAIPYLLLAALFVAVDPYPLYTQVVHHVMPSSQKSLGLFFGYYLHALWVFEIPIFLCSVVGVVMLILKRNIKLVCIFGLFFVAATLPMYIFLPNIPRYLVPFLPILSIVGGYGIYALCEYLPLKSRGIVLGTFVLILGLYAGALFGRYEVLLMHGDTRVEASQWIIANIPAGSTVITNSQSLHLEGTTHSLAIQQSISTSSLRAGDRVLLADGTLATHPFDLFMLHTTPVNQQPALVQAALKEPAPMYYVEDAWASTSVDTLLPHKVALKTFVSTNEAGLEGLSAGGDTEVTSLPVLQLLYGADAFGPRVTIYKLQ